MRTSRRSQTIRDGTQRHAVPTSRVDSISREVDEMKFANMNCTVKGLWLLLLPLLLILPDPLARAQSDIIGEWSPRVYNDGVDVGDYTGIPLNEAGRMKAETWHPDQIDLPENECRPHPIDIGLRVSVSQLRIIPELDPETQQQVGYRLYVAW